MKRKMVLKAKVNEDKEYIEVEDGKHVGHIISVEARTTEQGYEYVDFTVTVEDKENGESKYTYEDENKEKQLFTLKFGMNYYISPSSHLGMLCRNMGIELIPGQEIDLESLIGKPVVYQTTTKTFFSKKLKKDVSMANVLRETVKKG